MIGEKAHIINRVFIDLNIPASKEAEQNAISQKIKSKILGALERMGANLDIKADEAVYRIEKLSLNLNMGIENLEHLSVIIEDQLLEKIGRLRTEVETGNNTKGRAQQYFPRERNKQLFIHFLNTGQFPWWAGNGDTLNDLESWLSSLQATEWQQIIFTATKETKTQAVQRLSFQFSERLNRELIGKFYQNKSAWRSILALIDELIAFAEAENSRLPMGDGKIKLGLYQELWEYLLSSSTGKIIGKPKKLTDTLLSTAFQEISRFRNHDKAVTVEEWEHWLERSKHRKRADWLKLPKDIEKVEKKESTTEKADILEYDVFQAGLVLLYPFITRLLQNLELLKEGNFKDENAKERAVCLLHYLATKEEEFKEHSLALPMHLCSWPIGVPVNRFLSISDNEKEECDRVLKSAIQHWEALKSTTPEGMIYNFLRRDGKLKKESFGWTLYIEKKTHDILLGELPWGISIVKFKWMEHILTVNW